MDKRGYNRQDAIAYLGVRGRFFDDVLRQKLRGIRMGTCVVFDRFDLDRVFEEYRNGQGEEPTCRKAASASTKTQAGRGTSIKFSKVGAFARLSEQIAKRRNAGSPAN